jgi:hypothetical protein
MRQPGPDCGKRGISKAQFDVDDLTAGDSQPVAGLRNPG